VAGAKVSATFLFFGSLVILFLLSVCFCFLISRHCWPMAQAVVAPYQFFVVLAVTGCWCALPSMPGKRA
jgi:hypothetical protein